MPDFPAIAILGSRQVGKTTLAQELVEDIDSESVYLDLESPSDRNKLSDAEQYFDLYAGKEEYPLGENTIAIGLEGFMKKIKELVAA